MQKTTMRALCIALEGELDHHNTEAIRQQLDRAIARSRGNLILDFAQVTLMDSSGIGLLIGRYKKLKEKNERLRRILNNDSNNSGIPTSKTSIGKENS